MHPTLSIKRKATSRNWTYKRAFAALYASSAFRNDRERMEQAWEKINGKLLRAEASEQLPACIPIDYLGNRELLQRENKVSLICHRADSDLFEGQREMTLRAARAGFPVVSAFISPKEREILRTLIDERLPVIHIMAHGFDESYRPYGKEYDACVDGTLMQMTFWRHEQERATTTREQCLVMNELVRVITGLEDDWWTN